MPSLIRIELVAVVIGLMRARSRNTGTGSGKIWLVVIVVTSGPSSGRRLAVVADFRTRTIDGHFECRDHSCFLNPDPPIIAFCFAFSFFESFCTNRSIRPSLASPLCDVDGIVFGITSDLARPRCTALQMPQAGCPSKATGEQAIYQQHSPHWR